LRYLFEDFALDVDRRELLRGTGLLSVEPQVFDLLVYLLENRDRVVSKDDIIGSVWQGRLISESALSTRINAARTVLADSGEEQRLIKTLPRKGLRFVGAVRVEHASDAIPGRSRPTLALPDKPSIAVLPFANLTGEPEQDFFIDGIVEDIITALSRMRWLFVIARSSSFTYKGTNVDVKTVGQELGVRYILEGSVRRASTRMRISAQLIDAMTSGHHWAEQYDLELGDILAAQDAITRSVAAAIEPHLLAAEGIRALSHSSGDLGAWELVARARAHVWRLTRMDYEIAIDALKVAVEAYPDYAPARSLLGYCLVYAAHMGWVDRDQALLLSRQHASRAITLDDRDPWAYIALGYAALIERRTEDAIACFRRAVSLNPNSAAYRYHLSRGLAYAGQDREAIEHGQEAIRLSPLDPDMALFLGAIAVSHYLSGRYSEAAQSLTEALRLRPGFQGAQRLLCASLAQAGRIGEARALLVTLQYEQPQLSIEWIKTHVPYQTTDLMERALEGMRKVGLKEH
jgi:TolB-like protein/cytochrome c-type biogenesis protein CcmH/NrfG